MTAERPGKILNPGRSLRMRLVFHAADGPDRVGANSHIRDLDVFEDIERTTDASQPGLPDWT